MYSFPSLLATVAVPLAISATGPAIAVADTAPECVMFCEPQPSEQPGPDGCLMFCEPPTEQDRRGDECVLLCDQPAAPFPTISLTSGGRA